MVTSAWYEDDVDCPWYERPLAQPLKVRERVCVCERECVRECDWMNRERLEERAMSGKRERESMFLQIPLFSVRSASHLTFILI